MVVESNPKLQDIFREGLKKAGYRVLLTSDPATALSRFRQDATVAECVIFSTQELGEPALESFNHMGEDSRTSFIRAVLLLDQSQRQWKERASLAGHRIALATPLTMKTLRTALATLIEAATPKS
jgi:eukaryotic-like serine/threonine-protein kinase